MFGMHMEFQPDTVRINNKIFDLIHSAHRKLSVGCLSFSRFSGNDGIFFVAL